MARNCSSAASRSASRLKLSSANTTFRPMRIRSCSISSSNACFRPNGAADRDGSSVLDKWQGRAHAPACRATSCQWAVRSSPSRSSPDTGRLRAKHRADESAPLRRAASIERGIARTSPRSRRPSDNTRACRFFIGRADAGASSRPPRTAASHTRWNSSSGVATRMIASLVSLNAANMRAERCRASSAASPRHVPRYRHDDPAAVEAQSAGSPTKLSRPSRKLLMPSRRMPLGDAAINSS